MEEKPNNLGDSVAPKIIRTPEALGILIKEFREASEMTQLDLAGLANTGNRFIVELEKGKPTLQLGLVLKVIDLMGLELSIKRKSE